MDCRGSWLQGTEKDGGREVQYSRLGAILEQTQSLPALVVLPCAGPLETSVSGGYTV